MNPIIQIHIADIHFGSIDPKKEYDILYDQFISQIQKIPFHILAIDGDLFHKKYMANSDPIYYGSKFISNCIDICREKQATMIIISGTESHDADQLRLFYHYIDDPLVDVRVVKHIQFEYVKGLKILCIPEEYGKGEEYYFEYLSQYYDCCFFHGTLVGSVYGATAPNLNSPKYPIFDFRSFSSCRGPIIGGHVHKAMCLNSYMYYLSNPIRFCHGEEEDKGFAIVIMNNNGHYYRFIPIDSFYYNTIDIASMGLKDPDSIIKYVTELKKSGIDNIRLDFSNTGTNLIQVQHLVEQYYSSDNTVSIKGFKEPIQAQEVVTTDAILNKYSDISKYLLDPNIDEFKKMIYFINYNEHQKFITEDQLKNLLLDKK